MRPNVSFLDYDYERSSQIPSVCLCAFVCVCVSVNELPKVLEKYAFFAHNMPHGHGHSIHCVLCFAAKEEKKENKILAAKKKKVPF